MVGKGKGEAVPPMPVVKAAAAKAPAAEVAKAAAPSAPEEAAPAAKGPCAPRDPTVGMKCAIVADVINGVDMPSVNTFGGCDPFVEVRCVKGDPRPKGGDIAGVPKDSAKTKSIDGDLTPDWHETLTLAKASYGPDMFVTIILWDSNIAKNTPIGYQALPTTELLSGLQYNADSEKQAQKEHVATFETLLKDASMGLKATVNLAFSYVEVHKFKFQIKNGSHLPKVDLLGSIDAFIEVRLIDGDPSQLNFTTTPGKETLWSAKTKTVSDNMDPVFNEDLQVSVPADPSKNFVIVVCDSGAMGNTPIGMVVVPLKGLCSELSGTQEIKSKLTKLPNWDAPQHLSKAKVHVILSHDLAKG